jgi:putative spermidine/putrescine transport system permease protein
MGAEEHCKMASILRISFLRKWSIILFASLLGFTLFILPVIASSIYSFQKPGGKGYSFISYTWLLHQAGFFPSMATSLKLAVLAGILNISLMVPTMVYLNLTGQKFKPLVDFICILPLVIPVVSLAIGAQNAMPSFLQNTQYELVFFFVIIGLPFTYRTLDTSLQAISLKTLVEASRSLGASWIRTIIRAIVPAIRGGITGALFLTFALSIGEYTITSLLHWETFPTWTVVASQQNILGAIALSVFSFVSAIALLATVALFSKKGERQVGVDQ